MYASSLANYSKPYVNQTDRAPQGHFLWTRAGKRACETPDGAPVNELHTEEFAKQGGGDLYERSRSRRMQRRYTLAGN